MISKLDILQAEHDALVEGFEWAYESKAEDFRSYAEGITILTSKLLEEIKSKNVTSQEITVNY